MRVVNVEQKPLVSVILPTFNGSQYIRTAIESIQKQTYHNIELIIVNDCSTDNTAFILEQYAAKDHRIHVIYNAVNQKLPASLNIGFAAAKGDYFTWISDDNLFASYAVETLIEELKADDKIDIVYSSYYFIDEAGNKLDSFGSPPEELVFKCAPGACFLYKRKVHETLGGFDKHKFGMEDMDFWLRAATQFRYKYIDQKDLYYYRKHNNNLTSAIYSNPDMYREYRKNHLLSFEYFFKRGLEYNITDAELELHMELYFEDIVIDKNWNFGISDKVLAYTAYLDMLLGLSWEKVGFNESKVHTIINEKKKRIISLVINDLIFENQILQKKNPHIAAQLNRPISWYYKEYEVLPLWYKKLGHIIKLLQGNKSWKSLINNSKAG